MDDSSDSGAQRPGTVGVVEDETSDDLTAAQLALLSQALTPLPEDGPICVLADGTVRLVWKGPRPEKVLHTLELDPPTTGEYQALVAEQEKIEREATKRANGRSRAQSDCYKWWTKAAKLLSDTPLPPEKDCPSWLLAWPLVLRTVTTWLSVPTKAPGD